LTFERIAAMTLTLAGTPVLEPSFINYDWLRVETGGVTVLTREYQMTWDAITAAELALILSKIFVASFVMGIHDPLLTSQQNKTVRATEVSCPAVCEDAAGNPVYAPFFMKVRHI
jgi:hypothetical protein